jgi:Na+/H+ antiporter NhaD/arsenite permease-like protein
MSPVVEELVAVETGPPSPTVLWWSPALGSDLGGNATAVGASVNVVVLGMAARARHPISFWRFTRDGALVAAVTISLAALYLWLRHFVLAG